MQVFPFGLFASPDFCFKDASAGSLAAAEALNPQHSCFSGVLPGSAIPRGPQRLLSASIGCSVPESTYLQLPPPTSSTVVCEEYQASGTFRQVLDFKSPSHAPHPVPTQIFLSNSHPNEATRDGNEQEPFPPPPRWSPRPACGAGSKDGAACCFSALSCPLSQALKCEQCLPRRRLGASQRCSVYSVAAGAALCQPIASSCLASDLARSTQEPHSNRALPGQDGPFGIEIVLPAICSLRFLSEVLH